MSCFKPPSIGVTLSEFLKKASPILKVVFCGADSENFGVSLACVVLIGQQGVTDRRTDGRTGFYEVGRVGNTGNGFATLRNL